ncbi:hypothetical protein BH23ACT11_BH23ACT11_27670 [soil metagenome]
MVKIGWLDWKSDRVLHIAGHGVNPYEIEEAIKDKDRRIIKAGAAERNPSETIYRVYGRTEAGRHLLGPLLKYENGTCALPLTARDMTKSERRRYRKK